MVELEEWKQWEDVRGEFPSLKELYIEECPKLKEQLPAQLGCLKKLVIKKCNKLVGSAPSVPAIDELVLGECGKLMLESGLSTLRDLRIYGPFSTECLSFKKIEKTITNSSCLERILIISCDSLKSFHLYLFPKLQWLELRKCSNLESIKFIPEQHNDSIISLTRLSMHECPKFVWFRGFSAPTLQQLIIDFMENMRILFPSLVVLFVNYCPKVESFPLGDLPSNLEHLYISGCPKLTTSRMEWDLHTLASLRSLDISHVEEECFPKAGLLPPTLRDLSLCNCSNLRELDYKGLSCLSTLQYLYLINCPKLQCLPKEGLPASLSLLNIKGVRCLKGGAKSRKAKIGI